MYIFITPNYQLTNQCSDKQQHTLYTIQKVLPNVVIIGLKVLLDIYEIILIILSIVFIYGLLKYIFVSTYFKIKACIYFKVFQRL